MARYYIEDKDELAVFGCHKPGHILDHVIDNPELIEGNTEYIVCTYDRIDAVIPLDVKPLKQYINELQSRLKFKLLQ